MAVRKIPMSHNSVTGRHTRGPGLPSIGYESTLERDFVSLMMFNPDVSNIEEQPVRIDYKDAEGRFRHYTPDYLVERHTGQALLVEIKPSKFLKPELETKFSAARTFAAERVWTFHVWTEKEIRTPRLANIKFLLPFRNHAADPGRIARMLCGLEAEGPMTADELLQTCWNNDEEYAIGLSILWHLIAMREVETDLDQKLDMDAVLQWRPS